VVAGALALTVALLASACGGDGGSGDGGAEPAAFDVSLQDEPSEPGTIVSFFGPTGFTVATGQEVTFNLTNDGTAIHNMRIAGPDGEFNTDDDTPEDTDILNAGDTAVLKWTAPDEPETIEFRCDFHPTDMVGTITVESPDG
jgi:plastocyanin